MNQREFRFTIRAVNETGFSVRKSYLTKNSLHTDIIHD